VNIELFEPDDPIRNRRMVLSGTVIGEMRRAHWHELTDAEKDIEMDYHIKQNKLLARRLARIRQ